MNEEYTVSTIPLDFGFSTIDQIATNTTIWLTPLFTACVFLIIVLLLKDLATSIVKGLRFKLNRSFQEGNSVKLDGLDATIIKIGWFTTVFGIYNDDGTYCWRYVPNERIAFLKLEKIIHTNGKDCNSCIDK